MSENVSVGPGPMFSVSVLVTLRGTGTDDYFNVVINYGLIIYKFLHFDFIKSSNVLYLLSQGPSDRAVTRTRPGPDGHGRSRVS